MHKLLVFPTRLGRSRPSKEHVFRRDGPARSITPRSRGYLSSLFNLDYTPPFRLLARKKELSNQSSLNGTTTGGPQGLVFCSTASAFESAPASADLLPPDQQIWRST